MGFPAPYLNKESRTIISVVQAPRLGFGSHAGTSKRVEGVWVWNCFLGWRSLCHLGGTFYGFSLGF